jgi:hypothetical protein
VIGVDLPSFQELLNKRKFAVSGTLSSASPSATTNTTSISNNSTISASGFTSTSILSTLSITASATTSATGAVSRASDVRIDKVLGAIIALGVGLGIFLT